jgi:hypothetical protein
MDFIAKEDIVLVLVSPAGIGVGIFPGMTVFPFVLAILLTKFTGISPKVSGIYSRIAAVNYFKGYSLGNQSMKNFIEKLLS